MARGNVLFIRGLSSKKKFGVLLHFGLDLKLMWAGAFVTLGHLGRLVRCSTQKRLSQMFAISAACMHVTARVALLNGRLGDVLHGQIGDLLAYHLGGQMRKYARRSVDAAQSKTHALDHATGVELDLTRCRGHCKVPFANGGFFKCHPNVWTAPNGPFNRTQAFIVSDGGEHGPQKEVLCQNFTCTSVFALKMDLGVQDQR